MLHMILGSMNGEDDGDRVRINIQKSQGITKVMMADSVERETEVN